jgi:hypothetical protein
MIPPDNFAGWLLYVVSDSFVLAVMVALICRVISQKYKALSVLYWSFATFWLIRASLVLFVGKTMFWKFFPVIQLLNWVLGKIFVGQ